MKKPDNFRGCQVFVIFIFKSLKAVLGFLEPVFRFLLLFL